MKVKRDGKLQTVSSQEAALLRLVNQALAKGSPRALEKVLDLAQTFNDDLSPEAESAALSEDDLDIWEEYFARRRIKAESDEDELDGKEDPLP